MSLGVKKGDKVAIWATNIPEWLLTLFGAAKCGAILVTVNTNYKIFELEYLLTQSDTKVLVMMGGFKDSNYVDIVNELFPRKGNLCRRQHSAGYDEFRKTHETGRAVRRRRIPREGSEP